MKWIKAISIWVALTLAIGMAISWVEYLLHIPQEICQPVNMFLGMIQGCVQTLWLINKYDLV